MRLRRKLLFGGLASALVLCAGEAVLRVTTNPHVLVPLAGAGGVFRRSTRFLWALPPSAKFPYGARGSETLVTTNSLGYRSPELPIPRPRGTTRLLVLGDSSAMGHGVNNRECFPRRLEGLLRRSCRGGVEVINGAVPGYSSVQSIRVYRQLERFDPSIVVAYWGNSDSAQDRFEDHRALPGVIAPAPLRPLLRSYLYLNFRRLLRPYRGAGTGGLPRYQRVPLPLFRRNVEWLNRRLASKGRRLLLLLPPSAEDCSAPRRTFLTRRLDGRKGWTYRTIRDERSRAGMEFWQKTDYDNVARWLATRGQVRILDLPDLFNRRCRGGAGKLFLPSDGIHPSAAGHRLIARAVAARVILPDLLDCAVTTRPKAATQGVVGPRPPRPGKSEGASRDGGIR